MNEVCRRIENYKDISIWELFPFIFHFKNNKEEKNKSICQTYSWSKDGLKLYLFREYGPE